MEPAALPVVDLSAFMADEGCMVGEAPTEEQLAVAAQIDAIMQEHGFMYLENFGVVDEEVASAFDAGKRLFDAGALAPYTTEKNIGFTSFGKQNINHRRPKDLCETFTIKSPHMFDNDYRGSPEDFESTFNGLWDRLEAASRRFMFACALALGLPLEELDFFVRTHKRMDCSAMRINHYPPCHFEEGVTNGTRSSGAIRIGEHADFGMFTFLFLEDSAAGLQVRKAAAGAATTAAAGDVTADEKPWIEAPGRGGACAIVNSGCLLARWTNDRWRATAHRVVVPNAEEASQHRYSIPFFVHPDASETIEPHPLLLHDGQADYEPISAGEHLQMLIKAMQQPQPSGAEGGA